MKAPRMALILVMAGVVETAESQTLGFRVGAANSRQVDRTGPTADALRFNGGVVATTNDTSWLAFQLELSYSQKGLRNFSLDYLEIPILARLAVPVSDFRGRPGLRLQPFMVSGLAAAALVGCRSPLVVENPNSGPAQEPQFFTRECRAYTKGAGDLSLLIGTGLSLQFREYSPESRMTVEIRRTFGVKNLRPGLRENGCRCGNGWLINDATMWLVGYSVRLPRR